MNVRDKQVLVMGLGRFGGGTDVVRYLVTKGACVTVTDLATPDALKTSLDTLSDVSGVTYHLGRHHPHDFQMADLIVVNPAVSPENPYLKTARQQGVDITTQINLFLERCPATIIGITGANGKSTTTALCAHILTEAAALTEVAYGRVWLGGNLGHHPLLTCVDDIKAGDVVVLELSSFQTEALDPRLPSVKIALLTNLTPNHLDRHGSFDAYCAAKARLFDTQPIDAADPAVSVFCRDDPVAGQWYERYRRDTGRFCLQYSADDVGSALQEKFQLPGRANLANVAGAMAIAGYLSLTEDTIARTLETFTPLPHRLEPVAEHQGVRWFNDSIATTPESTLAALNAFKHPCILIAGGYDKGISLEALARTMAERAKAVILMGQTAEKLATAIKVVSVGDTPAVTVKRVDSLKAAVLAARSLAVAGDVVLLSPACASYDMFDNFQQRGEEFKQWVGEFAG